MNFICYSYSIFILNFLKALDDIGHGARWSSGNTGTPRGRRSGSAPGAAPLPAPTTKPPTPPAVVRSASSANTGTLGRGTLGMSNSIHWLGLIITFLIV